MQSTYTGGPSAPQTERRPHDVAQPAPNDRGGAEAPGAVGGPDVESLRQQLRSEQNYQMAFLGGVLGTLVGAAIWCVITVVSGYQIGWMAVGVGALAGLGVRAGRGVDPAFGVIGGALAVLGCMVGNVMTVCWVVSSQIEGTSFFGLLTSLDLTTIIELTKATLAPVDFLFYALAIGAGYKLSFRV